MQQKTRPTALRDPKKYTYMLQKTRPTGLKDPQKSSEK